VLKSLVRASELVTASATASKPIADRVLEGTFGASNDFATKPLPDSTEYDSTDTELPQARSEGGSPRGINVITLVLGVVVFAAAGLLTVIAGQRLVGRRFAVRMHAPSAVSASASDARNQTRVAGSNSQGAADPSTSAIQDNANKSSGVAPSGSAVVAHSTALAQTQGSSPPAGSLRVYQNGKEIFRMPPMVEADDAINSTTSPRTGMMGTKSTGAQSASGIEPAAIYELSPEVAEGSVLHRVEPDYPEQARQQQIEGPVVLDVRASRDGSIQEVKLVSGQHPLAAAAIAAVKQWRFRPRKVNGQPVEMETRVTLNFRLPH
jgi:TonB family protein